MTEFLRTFEPDLEVRSAAKGGDGRTIVGIAVPYRKPQRIDARLVEQFAPGAFDHQLRAAHRVPFARDHLPMGGKLIGRSLLYRNDAAGLYGEWRVSKTPAGEETLELVKDGALRELSIGFREGRNRALPGGVTERVRADLREVAVVVAGAYGDGATVAGVRSLDDDQGEDVDACPVCGHMRADADGPADLVRVDRARQLVAALPPLPAVAP